MAKKARQTAITDGQPGADQNQVVHEDLAQRIEILKKEAERHGIDESELLKKHFGIGELNKNALESDSDVVTFYLPDGEPIRFKKVHFAFEELHKLVVPAGINGRTQELLNEYNCSDLINKWLAGERQQHPGIARINANGDVELLQGSRRKFSLESVGMGMDVFLPINEEDNKKLNGSISRFISDTSQTQRAHSLYDQAAEWKYDLLDNPEVESVNSLSELVEYLRKQDNHVSKAQLSKTLALLDIPLEWLKALVDVNALSQNTGYKLARFARTVEGDAERIEAIRATLEQRNNEFYGYVTGKLTFPEDLSEDGPFGARLNQMHSRFHDSADGIDLDRLYALLIDFVMVEHKTAPTKAPAAKAKDAPLIEKDGISVMFKKKKRQDSAVFDVDLKGLTDEQVQQAQDAILKALKKLSASW